MPRALILSCHQRFAFPEVQPHQHVFRRLSYGDVLTWAIDDKMTSDIRSTGILGKYRTDDRWLYLESEAGLLHTLRSKKHILSGVNSDTIDWLECQATVNQMVTALCNGVATFRRWSPQWWTYGFLQGRPSLWTLRMPWKGTGRFSRRLDRYLGRPLTRLGDVYTLLKEVETFLLDPPSDIQTELLSFSAGVEPDPTRMHWVIPKMMDSLEAYGGDISAYVHGSMATGDYTAFSDVDDLVVIHSGAWQSLERFESLVRCFERLAGVFQRVDPLQHHGHWIFLDTDLACLDQSVMPLFVLEQGICVAGNRVLTARIRKDTYGFCRVLWSIVQDVRSDMARSINGELNLYYLKDLISGISLLPALAYQVQGIFFDKKTAIQKSSNLFSPEAMESVHWATDIRLRWAELTRSPHTRMLFAATRLLPARRPILERIVRTMGRAASVPSFGQPDASIAKAILMLTDECTSYLQDALGHST